MCAESSPLPTSVSARCVMAKVNGSSASSNEHTRATSAIALAAVLMHREHFTGRKVGIVLSGGNVDLDALPALLARAAA